MRSGDCGLGERGGARACAWVGLDGRRPRVACAVQLVCGLALQLLHDDVDVQDAIVRQSVEVGVDDTHALVRGAVGHQPAQCRLHLVSVAAQLCVVVLPRVALLLALADDDGDLAGQKYYVTSFDDNKILHMKLRHLFIYFNPY